MNLKFISRFFIYRPVLLKFKLRLLIYKLCFWNSFYDSYCFLKLICLLWNVSCKSKIQFTFTDLHFPFLKFKLRFLKNMWKRCSGLSSDSYCQQSYRQQSSSLLVRWQKNLHAFTIPDINPPISFIDIKSC